MSARVYLPWAVITSLTIRYLVPFCSSGYLRGHSSLGFFNVPMNGDRVKLSGHVSSLSGAFRIVQHYRLAGTFDGVSVVHGAGYSKYTAYVTWNVADTIFRGKRRLGTCGNSTEEFFIYGPTGQLPPGAD